MEIAVHPLHRQDEYGDSPMDRALRSGNAPIVDLLMFLDSHIDPHHDDPMIQAARQGDVARVRECLEQGEEIELEDELGMRLVHWAAVIGSMDLLKLLINRGVDLNARMHAAGAMTPLQIVNRLEYTDLAELLTRFGGLM